MFLRNIFDIRRSDGARSALISKKCDCKLIVVKKSGA